MKIVLFFILIFLEALFAELNVTIAESNSTVITPIPTPNQLAREKLKHEIEARQLEAQKKIEARKKAEAERKRLEEEKNRQILESRLTALIEEKKKINEYLEKDNLWNRVYSNHETYQLLTLKLQELDDKIRILKENYSLSRSDKKKLSTYIEDYQITEGKIALLEEYKNNPFTSLVEPPKIEKEPLVTNPVDIITAMSFEKQIDTINEDYKEKYESLDNAVVKLSRKSEILQEMVLKTRGKIYNQYVSELRNVENKLADFKRTRTILKTRVEAFDKDVDEIKFKINNGIEEEIKKSIITGSIILFLLLLFILIKFLVKKYMSENELYYSTNKALNFTFITIVFFILLFSYLENVGHLVTILSFASAGIAIALKDWFMSMMGWLVIIFSGSIHVGDRVKVSKDGKEYVGDVVDISLLRMTIHEDVTLTTYMYNRRGGRIFFIPNNYIFTDVIANYSHAGLKTVWDGIDFVITFDSNVAKAQSIGKEISRKYSKGYTDMTRKQLNKLRSKYSIRNTSVEPRILAYFDDHGVRISIWYLTNAYATLTLRSTISMEILHRIKEEDDISLAFPSQSIYMDRPAPKNPEDNRPKKEKLEEKQASSYKADDWGLY